MRFFLLYWDIQSFIGMRWIMVLTFVSFISYEVLCIYFFVCVKGKLIRYRYFFDTHVIDCFLRKMNLLLFNFITTDFQELLYDLLYHTQEKNVFYREREREREREHRFFFFWIFLSMCQWFGTNKFLLQWANPPNFSVPLRVF